MFRKKKNRSVSIELTDFLIRALICAEDDVAEAIVYEYALPPGIVVDETVEDELAFFDLLKELVKDWKIAKLDLRFFAQDHAVMMRAFDHPTELETEALKGYVEMELGRTIHLPFENPLIDIYDHAPGDGVATIFAVPSEEPMKLIQLYEDVRLHPIALDVRALSNLRFLESASFFSSEKTYLVADWSVSAVTITIYSDGNVDFLRYQAAEQLARNWRYSTDASGKNEFTYDGDLENYLLTLSEQVFEIERILNFYRFSLHKGEKAVDEIVLLGDHPEIVTITEQLRAAIEMPVEVIDDRYVQQFYPKLEAKHVALIGLALKGGS